MAELLFFRESDLLMRAVLRADRVTFGRTADADYVLPVSGVSRIQCEVVRRGDEYVLADCSGRGTTVSDRTADETGTVLREGDEIRLGEFRLTFSHKSSGTSSQATRSTAMPEADFATELFTRPTRHHAGSARLRLPDDAGERVVPLTDEEGFSLVAGASPGEPLSLRISDAHVSGQHFRVTYSAGQWRLRDLGSSNGTWVDGLRVIECVLGARATLRAGATTLHFEEAGDDDGDAQQPLPGLVTRDPAMRQVVELVRRVAPSPVAVALHGESGTGKEVVARAIHLLSDRRDGPFVAINCGALARDVVESELFGHEKGAFTGADRFRPGAFEQAHRGTIFLDEIAELPLDVQVKLLRSLERGEVRRLGATRTETVDVRVISATHADLRAAVASGAFREDLFYRLCVFELDLPPLRRRVLDVMPLARHFAAQFSAGPQVEFTPGACARLEAHDWPGNARELRNVIQVALVLRHNTAVTEQDLHFRAPSRPAPSIDALRLDGMTLDQIEREAYRRALERHGGDRKKAQTELGVARSTFFRRLDEFGLSRAARTGSDADD